MSEQHADWVRIHDRWSGGWRTGRTAYGWLLPLADPNIHRLVNHYQWALRDLPGFDLAPLEWLHLPVQDVGFTDEVSAEQADQIAAAARERGPAAPELTFQRAVVRSDRITLPASCPDDSLATLRGTLRAVVAEVLGDDAAPAAPEHDDLCLAYSTAEGTAAFAAATVGGVDVEPATVHPPTAELVVLSHDHADLQWQQLASVPLT